MTVSADKLQFILESTLQQSISFVKRGIFTQDELREMMRRREKLQKGMLKMQYKLTDYLAAIEYQYELERLRRFRMDQITKIQNGNINPSFKKQSSSDYAIIKRIIRLWDRTMHKYKFKLHIWKQYLEFCIAIGSKKHFYKTLTKALRFLPFQLDLWKIGVQYEKEHGHNYWKARKILLKGLKMIPTGLRNIDLGKYMISFEIQFIKALHKRNTIISKGQESMHFINQDGKKEEIDAQLNLEQVQQQGDKPEEEQMAEDFDNLKDRTELNNIKLNEYHEVVWLVIQQIIQNNSNKNVLKLNQQNIVQQIYHLLNTLFIENKEPFIRQILTQIKTKLQEYSHQEDSHLKLQVQDDNNEGHNMKIQDENPQFYALIVDDKINLAAAEILIKKYCLRVEESEKLFTFLANFDFIQIVQYLNRARFMIRLPHQVLALFLIKYLEIADKIGQNKEVIRRYLVNQIDKKMQASDYRKNENLLKLVWQFNASENRYESSTKIMRSLNINYKKEPHFLQTCNKICNSYN